MPQLMNVIKENNIDIHEQVFEEACYLNIAILLPQKERILSVLEQYEGLTVKNLGIH